MSRRGVSPACPAPPHFGHFGWRFHPKQISLRIGKTQDNAMRVFLAILIFSGTAFATNDFNRLIEQGRSALVSFDLDSAQTAFARACPPDSPGALPLQQAALCENEFGALAETRGQSDEAITHYLKALAGWEQLGQPSLASRVSTMTNLGSLYRTRHRPADAEKILGQAVNFAKTLVASDPELYATVLIRAAALYGDLDQPDRARTMLGGGIAGLHALNPPNAPELAFAYNELGMLDLNSGRYKTGEASLRQALSFATGSLGESNPETAAYSTNLALALLLQGEYSRAETLLRRARFVIEARLGSDSVQLVNVFAEMSSAETGLGKFRVAEEYGEKALSILSGRLPADSPEIVLSQVNLGRLYLREHKLTDAQRILPPAVDAERRFLKDGRTLGDGVRNLAALRVQQQSWNEAESLYREAIGLYERKLGADHPDIAPVLREYAAVLKHRGAGKAEVKSIETRARAIENPASRPQTS
jgi:tetratricopeptide (TPR) repeat protein